MTQFQDKLMKIQFGAISTNWVYELFYWCINSKTRTYKRVDLFLKEQLDNITDNDAIYLKAQSLRGETPDETAFNIEEWIWKNFVYKTDIQNFGMDEYWAIATEVFKNDIDDCDGLNSLIYIMCRLAGIGSSCLYSVLGDTATGYHYYCLYYSPDMEKLVKLDATYYPEIKSIKDKKAFQLDFRYTRIDYIFNDEGSWRC
jgi:hypothetical protein